MAAMQLMYDCIRMTIVLFISSKALNCDALPNNDQYPLPRENLPSVTNPNASSPTCGSFKNPSGLCQWHGGWCEPLSWESKCHFFEKSICPDGGSGCCFMCHGSCGENGSCRQWCNAGEVEIKGENCCRGSKYGCKCCVSAEDKQTASIKGKDCKELLDLGDTTSGVRTIYLNDDSNTQLEVYCDQETDNGGWTVIQRRINLPKIISFYREWTSYEDGFGNKNEEYWLGNKYISYLTLSNNQELRIDLTAFDASTAYAKYGIFKVEDSSTKYRLTVTSYSGTAGDELTYNNGMKFSTKDEDNDLDDGNCGDRRKSGWWFNGCTDANLNGIGYNSNVDSYDSVYWLDFRNFNSLAYVSMKIRPTGGP